MLPAVVDALEKGDRIAVEGTPGIGKTLFGYCLLRYLVSRGVYSVLYWAERTVTLMTPSTKIAERYGLTIKHNHNGVALFFGVWRPDEYLLRYFLLVED